MGVPQQAAASPFLDEPEWVSSLEDKGERDNDLHYLRADPRTWAGGPWTVRFDGSQDLDHVIGVPAFPKLPDDSPFVVDLSVEVPGLDGEYMDGSSNISLAYGAMLENVHMRVGRGGMLALIEECDDESVDWEGESEGLDDEDDVGWNGGAVDEAPRIDWHCPSTLAFEESFDIEKGPSLPPRAVLLVREPRRFGNGVRVDLDASPDGTPGHALRVGERGALVVAPSKETAGDAALLDVGDGGVDFRRGSRIVVDGGERRVVLFPESVHVDGVENVEVVYRLPECDPEDQDGVNCGAYGKGRLVDERGVGWVAVPAEVPRTEGISPQLMEELFVEAGEVAVFEGEPEAGGLVLDAFAGMLGAIGAEALASNEAPPPVVKAEGVGLKPSPVWFRAGGWKERGRHDPDGRRRPGFERSFLEGGLTIGRSGRLDWGAAFAFGVKKAHSERLQHFRGEADTAGALLWARPVLSRTGLHEEALPMMIGGSVTHTNGRLHHRDAKWWRIPRHKEHSVAGAVFYEAALRGLNGSGALRAGLLLENRSSTRVEFELDGVTWMRGSRSSSWRAAAIAGADSAVRLLEVCGWHLDAGLSASLRLQKALRSERWTLLVGTKQGVGEGGFPADRLPSLGYEGTLRVSFGNESDVFHISGTYRGNSGGGRAKGVLFGLSMRV